MANNHTQSNTTTYNSNELIGGGGGDSISRVDSFAGQRPPIFSDGLQRSPIEPRQTFGTRNEVRTNSRTMEETGDKASAMPIAVSGEGGRAPGLVQMGRAPAANFPAQTPASDRGASSHGNGLNLSLSCSSMGNYGSKRMIDIIPEYASNPRARTQAYTGGLIPNMSSTGCNGMAPVRAVAPGLGFKEILLHWPVDRSIAGSPPNLSGVSPVYRPVPIRLALPTPKFSPWLKHMGSLPPAPSPLAPAQNFPTGTQSPVSDGIVATAGHGNGLSLSAVGKHGLEEVLDSRAEPDQIKDWEAAAKSHTASLTAKVAELEEENKRLREENNRLSKENSRFSKKNSRLSQENSRLDNRLRKEME